MMAQRWCDCS